jgi:hypothetical protein
MAFDAQRGRVVLFGGRVLSGTIHDTWELNGDVWTQVATSGPTGGFLPAMTYDSVRAVTVLSCQTNQAQQTWEWNGAAWSLRSATGPSRRYGAAMAFDTTRAVTVLHGGTFGGFEIDDTWEWNGVTWTQRAVSGPGARYLHTLTFDPIRNATVLIGGYRDNAELGDAWMWNGTAWSRLPDPPFAARGGHAALFNPRTGRINVYGGILSSAFARLSGGLWEGDGTGWTAVTPELPPARDDSAMVTSRPEGVRSCSGVAPRALCTSTTRGSSMDDGGLWRASAVLRLGMVTGWSSTRPTV